MSNFDLRETTDIKIKLVLNILAFSDIIRSSQEPCLDIQAGSVAWVSPVYSKPWQIQKPGIFRTLPYSETWYIQNPSVYKTLAYLQA